MFLAFIARFFFVMMRFIFVVRMLHLSGSDRKGVFRLGDDNRPEIPSEGENHRGKDGGLK